VPLFALGFSLPYSLFSLPLGYYTGFVLPHRYGQSTQSFKSWVIDQLKGLALTGALGLPILLIIYALLGAAPQTWWLWTAAVLLLFTVILSNLAPVLLFPLFFKYSPLEDEA
jgi:STE24 endopeptidase